MRCDHSDSMWWWFEIPNQIHVDHISKTVDQWKLHCMIVLPIFSSYNSDALAPYCMIPIDATILPIKISTFLPPTVRLSCLSPSLLTNMMDITPYIHSDGGSTSLSMKVSAKNVHIYWDRKRLSFVNGHSMLCFVDSFVGNKVRTQCPLGYRRNI